MKTIELTRGYLALIDDEDYERVSEFSWHAHESEKGRIYARHRSGSRHGVRMSMYMHRFITKVTDRRIEVDHKDSNGLNNQRSNLRIATSAQNKYNAQLRSDNTSGFKGVVFDKRKKTWEVTFNVNKKRVYVGQFKDKIEAARAYDAAIMQHHGEFARTNKSLGLIPSY